ncbi:MULTISPECIES: phage holin family protein [Bacillus]|uniref:phage holin family protein n=1 Tax=Bacillus TaxID=1386 RepID=UPI000305FFB9|nr:MULTISPECIES: phage holin family protein [Bacillus]
MKLSSLRLPLFAFLGGSLIHMSGEYSQWILMVLGWLLVIDLVSFLLVGIITKTLKWEIFIKETLKRGLLIGIIIISFILDELLNTGDMIRNATLLFYISNEMAIILGYAIKVGVPLPDWIVKIVEFIQNDIKNKNDQSKT